MRSFPAPSPVRKGKRRLLESCAITAGLIALAYGGPAMAQGVIGTGNVVNGPAAGTITDTANKTTVTVTGSQTIVNWTPSGTPDTDGVIEFLPVGNTLEFRGGLGGYTVLNRFVNGGGGSVTDTIALSGTVNSYLTAAGIPDQQGGSIWFYNAGGILVNPRAAINVGSLVLTANDIDTTGGLFGPGGEIRFRGAANSDAAVTVSPTAFIGADNGVAGSNYVALVAPRVVQNGNVSVSGSAAYVAAEQADIRINNGLFDINVLIGASATADGSPVLQHGGNTGGDEETGTTYSNRIYLVAIPKNDAVTMLVGGQIGYQDAAVATQTDSNGAVVLSAGYNVTAGVMESTPANAAAANITSGDVIFRSNVTAHASGDFVGQPLATIPPIIGPVAPSPTAGRFVVQGNGTFIGENSATLTVNTGRIAGATGNLTVQAGGSAAAPGTATVNVDGGQMAVLGNLAVSAPGALDAVTGDRTGGAAALNILNGGQLAGGGNVNVAAQGVGGFGAGGDGGDGRGGSATITVSGPGSQLTAGAIIANANGTGGGMAIDPTGGVVIADNGGGGFGGNATIAIADGASVTATTGIGATAGGAGRIGTTQSGNGQGGTARIEVTGVRTTLDTPLTAVAATGTGGGTISSPVLGTFFSLNAGDGQGGNATLSIGADVTSAVVPGAATVSAAGTGGGANGENATGGNGQGGNATAEVTGGAGVAFDTLTLDVSGTGGGASAPSGLTGTSGNGRGGIADVSATGGSTFGIAGDLSIDAHGSASPAPNVGSADGGDVTLYAGSALLTVGGIASIDAYGSSQGSFIATTTGAATGGDVDLLADVGTISASNYSINAGARVANGSGAGGPAQGGTIDLDARNAGRIEARTDGTDTLDASARSGVSDAGSPATGGTIRLIATSGSIGLANSVLVAGGISGGAAAPGSASPLGLGGDILIQTAADPTDSSAIAFITLDASADGRTAVDAEGVPGLPLDTAGNGRGGSIAVDVQGGTLDAGSLDLSADGYGGGTGTGSAAGDGGRATFTQTGGTVTIGGDMTVHASGFGGTAEGLSGTGTGGTATIDLGGGTITAADIGALANGEGGVGSTGSDEDPSAIVPGGAGGAGQGGDATINIGGAAVVDASTIGAYSGGSGGAGGDFFNASSFGGSPGTPGSGGGGTGGNATVNLNGGTVNSTGVVADATGIGGSGGASFFSSSSGGATGIGIGGNGGSGQGGTATIALTQPVGPSTALTSISQGLGGDGGAHNVGGAGGDGFGGTAQAIVTGFDAGALAVTLDSSATGGDGGDGRDGDGGSGGSAFGGTSRLTADGTDAALTTAQASFITGGAGGTGGDASLGFGAFTPNSPGGGNGGAGIGGTIEIVANEGGTVSLAGISAGPLFLSSTGTGGGGGRGADNSYSTTLAGPDGMFGTADDIIVNAVGGNGGVAGSAVGGTVHLLANGGTITSAGNAVNIQVGGVLGDGGDGGDGPGGTGACCTTYLDEGGDVLFESLTGVSGPGRIDLGDTTITASGGYAGRIEIVTDSTIQMASLTANAAGFAAPTNSDTDLAPAGIFLNVFGDGAIRTDGNASLATDSSVGVYAQANGQFDVGGDLTVDAGDQVDIRHDYREGSAPTIVSGGGMSFTAASTIRSAPGSLVRSGTSLSMIATGLNSAIDVDSLDAQTLTLLLAQNGRINVYGTSTSGDDLTASAGGEVAIADASAGDDISLTGNTLVIGRLATSATGLDSELDGSNIFFSTAGAATVEHADAANDFTANTGSFATGLNSIITGGDISIVSPGAVDLGNSDAGGFVSVNGQSIAFNTITAGLFVDLVATGTATGAEGITGGSITADSAVGLDATRIAIGGTVDSGGSITANSSAGPVAIANAVSDDFISVGSAGDITGNYTAVTGVSLTAGGNINGSASATGFESSSSGPPIAASVFVDAAGDVTLQAGNAAGMYGVRAGGAATLTGVGAGEDLFVRAGTGATLTNATAGDDLTVQAGGTIIASGLLTTGAGPDGQSIGYNDNPVTMLGFGVFTSPANGSNIDLSGANIAVSTANAFDNLTANAAGTIASTGLLRSGLVTDLTAGVVNLTAVTAGTDINIDSNSGVSATGALSAGHDVTIVAANAVNVSELDAGDDIRVNAGGALTIGGAYSFGTGLDNDSDGSNIVLTAGGTSVDHAEADNDFAANVASFTTGLDSIIALGDISITAAGPVDLGISDAGGFVSVSGQSIAFNTITAGSTVGLTAGGSTPGTNGITGGSIDAGSDVTLTAADIAIDGTVDSGGSIFASSSGGGIAIGTASADDFISIDSAGDITGTYNSFSGASLVAAGDIDASASATGFESSSSGTPITANVFVDAVGDATLQGGSATGMYGVRAGGAASLTGIGAGEDLFVEAGTTATLGNLTAGDDLTVQAGGTIAATGLTTTGTGPDGRSISYIPVAPSGAGGFFQIQGTPADQSNITLSAPTAAINAANIDAFDNFTATAGGIVTATGPIESGRATTIGGASLNLQSITAGTDIDLTSTSGNIASTGDIDAGGDIGFDAAGDIDHAADRLLTAGNAMTLTASGNIAVGNAGSGGDMLFDAGGAIAGNALTSDRNILLLAGSTVELTGDATAGLALRIEGSAVDLGDIAVDANELGITAATGGVSSTGTIDVNGPVTVSGAGAVSMTGDITAPSFISIRGASVTVGNITGGAGIDLTATNGAVASAGTIDAGRDIFISTTNGGNFNRLVAGDDIGITGSGNVSVAFMDASGTNQDGEEVGSNVGISLAGNVSVEHGEAAGDITVAATSFRTGLNSLIADGNIAVDAAGPVDLGNSTAGGYIRASGASIAFATLDAGDYVDLDATGSSGGVGPVAGTTILAGSDVFLAGGSIDIGSVQADGSLSGVATTGAAAIGTATIAGNIGMFAAGNLTGNYGSGGNISLSSGANIDVTANAAGGFPDPDNGDAPTGGNLYLDAAGNVALADSSAAGMLGVNGGAVTLGNVDAGEDMLVLARTTAGLTEVSAGDDIDVRAGGAVTANDVSATGAGPDGFVLTYSATGGFTIGQGEGSSSLDGADIDIASSGGSIAAGGLSAGDDILLTTATTLAVDGAVTRGLGITGGSSMIRAQSGGDATFAGLSAFDDIDIDSTGAVGVTGTATAGRDIAIDGASVTAAALADPAGNMVNTVAAARDLAINASGAVDAGALRAGRNMALTGGTTATVMQAVTGAGGTLSIDAADGISVERIQAGGTTSVTSSDGAIAVSSLSSVGPVAASGDSIAVSDGGNLVFSQLDTDVGDADVSTSGNLAVTAGQVAGRATLGSTNGDLSVTQLGATDVQLASDDDMTLGTVTASNTLLAEAGGVLTVDGAVSGRQMSVGSADIVIATNARLGTPATTEALDVRNTSNDRQTFIGGTGTRNGYHLDQTEMTRLFGGDISIFAPQVDQNQGGFVASAPGALAVPIASVGSSAQPDVIIDDFTLTAGGSTSNLGAGGSLTIQTPGKLRVVGDAQLTGLGDANALNLIADNALEVILGQGSVRLSNGTSPAGQLNMVSEDIIVATEAAITEVGAASTTDAIETRLAQNDGVTLDEGPLFARGINVDVVGGFYVQNSGTGTDYADRRGLTFGAGGLNVNTGGSGTRIVINGVHLGPSGPVTGLDTIPLLTINGVAANPAASDFDPRSTFNGCLIASTGTCTVVRFDTGTSFPVQDVIEEESDADGDNSDGMALPTALITMRDLDPLTGEPLLDDPVTGAGNDDLWTPAPDTQQP